MPLRIFLSSLCYELRDLRAVLTEYLFDQGIDVYRSEEVGFPIYSGYKPYVSCLKALEECQMVVGIIDRQYGKVFDDWTPYTQYNGLSPMHAEMRHALKMNIKLILYVQSDTMAIYEQWRKNKEAFERVELQNKLVIETLSLIEELKKVPDLWIEEFVDATSIMKSMKSRLVNEIYQSLIEQKSKSDDESQYLLNKIFELSPQAREEINKQINPELLKNTELLKSRLAEVRREYDNNIKMSDEKIEELSKEKASLDLELKRKIDEIKKAKMQLFLAAAKDTSWLKLIRTHLMEKEPGRVPFHNDAEVAIRGYHCSNLRDKKPNLTKVTWKLLPYIEDNLHRGYKAGLIFTGDGFSPGIVFARRLKGVQIPGEVDSKGTWSQPNIYFGDYLEVATGDDLIESPLGWKGYEFCVKNPNGKCSEWIEFSYEFDFVKLSQIMNQSGTIGKKQFSDKKYDEAIEPLRKAYVFSDCLNGKDSPLTKEYYQLHEEALDLRTLVTLRFSKGKKLKVVSGAHASKKGILEGIKTRSPQTPYQILIDETGERIFVSDSDVEEDK